MIKQLALGGALVLAGVLAPQTAHAADQLPGNTGSNYTYMGWRTQSTRACFEYPDSGGLRKQVSAAVNTWNASQAAVYRRQNCAASGFSAAETVRMKMDSLGPGVCAVTPGGGNGADVPRIDAGPVYVRMKLTGTVTIKVNSDVAVGCRMTADQWQHLITHELGHRLGLGHAAGGVMAAGSWSYSLPTSANVTQLDLLY